MAPSDLAVYQSELTGCDLRISELIVEYRISESALKEIRSFQRKLFIACLASFGLAALFFMLGSSDFLVEISVISGGLFLFTVMAFSLMLVLCREVTILDLKEKCFRIKKKTWMLSDIKKVVVRRNVYNQRYSSTANSIADKHLQSVSVNIHMKKRLSPIIFGNFKSTVIAYNYCKDLIAIIGYTGKIEIDGQYQSFEDSL